MIEKGNQKQITENGCFINLVRRSTNSYECRKGNAYFAGSYKQNQQFFSYIHKSNQMTKLCEV